MDLISESMPARTKKQEAVIGFLAWSSGAVVGLILLAFLFSPQDTNFEELALGGLSASVMASANGYRIHCGDSRDVALCLAGVQAAGFPNVVLWLGNSQLHAVNQLKNGETNAPRKMFDGLIKHGYYLMTLSQPNANLQEHFVAFEYMAIHAPVNVLLLPLVFDDMREEGIRKEIAELALDAETRNALLRSPTGRNVMESAIKAADTDDTSGIAHTVQQKVESVIDQWLDANSELWRSRPEIRGQLFNGLYMLRNWVLGIKPTSKRKTIPARYAQNFDALKSLIGRAGEIGVKVIMYIAPIRNDVEIPYVRREYEKFKAEMEEMAMINHAAFFNLEALVPNEYWGSKPASTLGGESELDFMHFQAAGHAVLAVKLEEIVSTLVSGKPGTPP